MARESSQLDYDVRCEWGGQGVQCLGVSTSKGCSPRRVRSEMRSAALKDALQKVAVQKREFEQAGVMVGDLVNATARFVKHQVSGWPPVESDEGRKEGAVYSSVPDKATFKQQVTMVYEIVGE